VTGPAGRALTAATLRGVWATVLLPWTRDDELDLARLDRQLAILVATGVDGVYAHGTAGEFHELDDDEFDRVNTAVAAHCRAAGLPFQLGASQMSARVSRRRIRSALRHRPAALQVILPDWLPLTTEEAVRAVVGFADEAGDVPLVLYQPPHAKSRLDPSGLVAIADAVPQLIGLKVADGEPDWYRQMEPLLRRLAVFVPGHRLATGLRAGASGAYSNVACLSPRGAMAWYRLMHDDPELALDVERRLGGFLTEHIGPLQREGYANPALDKALACLGGWCDVDSRVRSPYRSVDAARLLALRPVVRAAVPELFPGD
jgi:dihydrodipicolinate synthase/N-acetylneuraminate lyase